MAVVSPERTKGQVLASGGISSFSTGPQALGRGNLGDLTYKKVRELREDPTVKLCRRFMIAPVIASGWAIESDEGVPDEVHDFVWDTMDPHHDHLFRTALQGASDYGWQPYEMVLGTRPDGLWDLRKLKPLLQDYTDVLVDPSTGAYAGLKNFDVALEPEETLLISQDVEGSDWYGISDMRSVWQAMAPYEEVKETGELYDRKVSGAHLVIKFPEGETTYNGVLMDNGEIARQLLAKFEANGRVAIPQAQEKLPNDPGWAVELLEASGQASTYLLEKARYLDVLKVRAYGFPERAILEGEFGTKAEAETHGDLAVVNIELRRRDIVRAVNWHVVNRLVRFNFGEQWENKVRLVPNPLNDASKKFLQEVFTLGLASQAGLELVDRIDFEALRERLEVPTLPEVPPVGPPTP